MGVWLLNIPGCVNCYHEDGLGCWKCVIKCFILYHILINSSEDAGLVV